MDDENLNEQPCAKRKDVGYKRPPREHQFKPGQKPPPRKKKPTPRNVTQTLEIILREERRLDRGGKPQWITVGAMLVEKAYQLAEQGNPTLSRALVDYLMSKETAPSPNQEPVYLYEPDSDFHGIYHYTRQVPI